MCRIRRSLSVVVAAGLLVLGSPPRPSSAAVSCFSSATYATETEPGGVAAANFNADSSPDLVIANFGFDSVSVTLNNGDGTFADGVNFPTGMGPQDVTTGDLNHDGAIDVVAADSGANAVSVVLGNGDGTFGPASDNAVAQSPRTTLIGRFNGDSIPDLAVADYGPDYEGGWVSILLGLGDGSFRRARNFDAGVNPVGLNGGDFNHDGSVDLAVPNNNPPFGISILRGNGDGSFQPPVLYSLVGINARGPAVGDFNRDGNLDLAVATYQFPSGVSVLLGKGDGTFGSAVHYRAGKNPEDITAADMNRDGVADLIVSNSASNSVSILTGNGDGTFGAPHNVSVGAYPVSSAVALLDQNLAPDIATTTRGDNAITVLLRTRCG